MSLKTKGCLKMRKLPTSFKIRSVMCEQSRRAVRKSIADRENGVKVREGLVSILAVAGNVVAFTPKGEEDVRRHSR